MLKHILEYQLYTLETVDVVQCDKLCRNIEMSFFKPHLTHRDKMKILKPYCTSTRHTKSYPRVSFVYSMKYRQSSSDTNVTKSGISWPLFDPWAKHKILKPYCASARHVQSDPRI